MHRRPHTSGLRLAARRQKASRRKRPVSPALMAAAMGTLDILSIAPGERLGYYRLLAGREPLTSPGLAAASRTAPPGYLRLLAEDWLAALPEVQQRLRAARPPAWPISAGPA